MDSIHERMGPVLASDTPEQERLRAAERVIDLLESAHGRAPAPGPARPTPGGEAIDPHRAATSGRDLARTVAFWRGLHGAIARARPRPGDQAVLVLDAGCGPLALLSLPVAAFCAHAEGHPVRVRALDLFEASLESVRVIATNLDLSGCLDLALCEDACSYTPGDDWRPDVVVTETMLAGLEREPQVAISRHLLGRYPEASLVPERVRIELALVEPGVLFQPGGSLHEGTLERATLVRETVFVLDRDRIASWRDAGHDRLPAGTLRTPERVSDTCVPMLLTTVETGGGHALRAFESGLTTPRVVRMPFTLRPGGVIRSWYRLGADPGLEFEQADEP